MNQQRSRRFRSAKEAKEKDEDKAEFMKLLKQQNGGILPDHALEEAAKKTWDSNAITPGTPFMDTLAASLRYWIAYKLNQDAAWKDLKIIISDASVPGEGEHKIMEFIRSQRSSPDHDPNTKHVIYGLDADLIMLGLATHEPYFRVLREDVFFQESKARTCRICGQTGHFAAECRGEIKKKVGEFDEKANSPVLKPFIWLHVSILREYLAVEMEVNNSGFKMDVERAIDDWIFMCFFVGNDFLPHLPSLDIREQGIDTLIAIWRDNLPIMGGYVTKDGFVDFQRAQHILAGLAKQEDAIFQRRREEEERRDAKEKRRQQYGGNDRRPPKRTRGDNSSLQQTDFSLTSLDSLQKNDLFRANAGDKNGVTHDMIMNKNNVEGANKANKSAAALLKEKLAGRTSNGIEDSGVSATSVSQSDGANGLDTETTTPTAEKRKRELADEDDAGTPGRHSPDPAADAAPVAAKSEPDAPPADEVRLWEAGYRDRYYSQKFHKDPEDQEFRHQVARDYAVGLQWVLLYYFQGCPSWTWYYPHHYAPFAADFVDIGSMEPKYDLGKPFKPYEQLMGVMPAASNHTIPSAFHSLMTDEDSDIVDFYPEDFPVDLNGKKWAWQGVALLPFIDEKRLLKAMGTKYPLLTEDEVRRNEMGRDALLFSDQHPLYEGVVMNFYSKKQGSPKYKLIMSVSGGLAGKVEKNEDYIPSEALTFPLPGELMPDLDENRSIAVHYEMPKSSNVHKSMILRGVRFPPPTLTPEDKAATAGRAQRSGRSHGGAPLRSNSNRGGRGGGRGGGINYGGPPSASADTRPNPFGAHINPAFFPNGFPPPPIPGGAGWPQQPGYGAPPGYGMPPVPVPPIPGQNYYNQPPPMPPGYGNGSYGGQQGYNGGYNTGGYSNGGQNGYYGGRR